MPDFRTVLAPLFIISTVLILTWFTIDRAQRETNRSAQEEQFLTLVYQANNIHRHISNLRHIEISQLLFEERHYDKQLQQNLTSLNNLLATLPTQGFEQDLQQQINLLSLASKKYMSHIYGVTALRAGEANWQQIADAEIALNQTALNIENILRDIKDYSFTGMVQNNSQTTSTNTTLIFVAWAAVLALIILQSRSLSTNNSRPIFEPYSHSKENLALLMQSMQEVRAISDHVDQFAHQLSDKENSTEEISANEALNLSAVTNEIHNAAVKSDALIEGLEDHFSREILNLRLHESTQYQFNNNETRPH